MFVSDLIQRYQKLLDGEKEALTREEDLFVYSYHSGSQGIDMLDVLLEIEDETSLTEVEKDAINIGYSLGQKAMQKLDIINDYIQ